MPKTLNFRNIVFAVSFAAFAFSAHAQDHEISEHARLAVLVRQLDMLERIATESQVLSQNQTSRYHFDYSRLHADMQRVRCGIRDYLRPQRAQPRDPVEITGQYVIEHITERTTEHTNSGKGQP
jgi:RAQPRD family integrative conjugative element protein